MFNLVTKLLTLEVSGSQNAPLLEIVTFLSLPGRPDTSRRQRRQLPPCPLVIAFVPLKCSSRNLQFPHRVPFTKENMPRCPCPLKAKHHCLFYLDEILIYQDRKEALTIAKKNKGARFKVFKTKEEAETFAKSNQDLSTPKPPSEASSNQVNRKSNGIVLWTTFLVLRILWNC